MPIKPIQLSSIFLVAFIITVLFTCGHQNTEYSLIPAPVSIEYQRGHFVLSNQTALNSENEFRELAAYLQNQVAGLTGIALKANETSPPNAIHLQQDRSLQSDEAYQLKIADNRIEISAKKKAGVFYGIQTLLQIITEASHFQAVDTVLIRKLTITDYARFKWRGMHLDVSRHFFPVDFILKYIDILALHKINVFHWHLVDDQGWRIEIKRYPKLTRQGAWRKGTGQEPWTYFVEPATADAPQYGGFYTQDEIKRVLKYAAQRHITIVPEIEMPGHSWAAIYAYPELSCSGIPWKKSPEVPFEFSDPYCAGNEKTFEFLENILAEVIELFPSEYIHIGGDEAKKTPWEKCPKCQQRMQSEGLNSTEELQSYFIKRIEKFITSKGRKLIGWDEILEGGLAPTAAVMSWRGETGGIEAAEQNHYVVMTPNQYTYFNSLQADTTFKAGAEGDLLSLKKVYHYDPLPQGLAKEKQKFILGAQGCLWTENVPTTEVAEYQLLPRLCALAEVVWSPTEKKDFLRFRKRMKAHYHRLSQAGFNYFVDAPAGFTSETVFLNEVSVTLTNPLNYGDIFYSLDGQEPTQSSLKYSQPIKLTQNATIKAKIILPTGKESYTKTGTFLQQTPLVGLELAEDFLPGVKYKYFTGAIQSLDQFSALNFEAEGTVDSIYIPSGVREDLFGLEFQGFLQIPKMGIYTLYTTSDDGTQLFLHEKLFINNDGIHAPQTKSRQVILEKGMHPLRVRFFEGLYGQHLEVGFIDQANRKVPFTGADLFHD